MSQRVWQVSFIARKDNKIINTNETDIDLKQDGNERQPIDVFPIESDEIFLVSFFFGLVKISMLQPSQRALNLNLKYESPCRKDIAIKRHDLDEKPHVDSRELNFGWRIHLKVLRIEYRVLVLENGNGIKHFLHHITFLLVADQAESVEHWHEDVCQIELE